MKKILFVLSVLLFSACGENKPVEEKPELLPIMEKALLDVSSRFYANFAQFPKEKKSLPIGVFDSGTGGLTVLEVLLSSDQIDNITGKLVPDGIPDFEGEHFTYVADRANMPYGNYAAEGKEKFFKELIIKDALFLLGNKYYFNPVDKEPQGVKDPSKIIIVACNTATAYGLSEINTLLKESGTGVKVIGVINAGVGAFFQMLEGKDTLRLSKKDSVAVGVLATVGTISSGAYERTIREMQQARNYKGYIKVVNQPGGGFAEAVDSEPDYVNNTLKAPRTSYRGPVLGSGGNDIKRELLSVYRFDYSNHHMLATYGKGDSLINLQLNSAANYARFHLVSLLEKHKKSSPRTRLRHVILGCTHYPFLLDTLKTVMNELREYQENGIYKYRHLIAKEVNFIDPAVFTAIECYKSLRADKALALRTSEGKLDAYISVPVFGLEPEKLDGEANLAYPFKYGREYGTEEQTTVFVPFSSRYINKENLDRIERMLPHSFKKINTIID